jgi:hypothetical protein
LAPARMKGGGKRENMGFVLYNQRAFTEIWSKKFYTILHSVIKYFYSTGVSLNFFDEMKPNVHIFDKMYAY